MIEIVLSVCMLADPAKCKDVHLSYAAESTNITPQQCMMNGQPVDISLNIEVNFNLR